LRVPCGPWQAADMTADTAPDAAAALAAASRRAAGVHITADGVQDLQAAQLGSGQPGPEPGEPGG